MKVRFADQSRSPSDAEMVSFVTRNMGIKPDQVSHLYYDPFEKCIVIKFTGETLMKMCLEQHVGEKNFNFSNGQYSRVMITDGNEEIKYVRIFYLPPEVPDQEVLDLLKKFGSIKRIVQEKRAVASGFNCYSGTRGIYMDVQKEIPPQLYICNYRCRVYYTGMQERCFICKSTDHLKSDCPRRVVGGKDEGGSGSKSGLTPHGRVAAEEQLKSSITGGEGIQARASGVTAASNIIGTKYWAEEDSMMTGDEQLSSGVENSHVAVSHGTDAQNNKDSEWIEVKPKSNKDVGSPSNGECNNDSESGLGGKVRDRKRVDGGTGSSTNVADVLVSSNPFDGLGESMEEGESPDTDPKRRKT